MRIQHVLFLGAVLGILSCCTTGGGNTATLQPGSGDEGPGTYFQRFRRSLDNGEWKYVHLLLSKRARNCYSQSMLKRFLTRTKPGALEQSRLLYWDVVRVEREEGKNRARILLVHPRNPKEYRRWYPYVKQNDIWRLDWSLADIFQVPRSVEDCD